VRQSGFSLLELVVVILIMSALLGMGLMQFGSYTRKSQIERQMRTLNADLAEVRLQALYRKRARAVVISGTQFAIYSSAKSDVQPVTTRTLAYPVRSNAAEPVIFEINGMLNVGGGRAFCLNGGTNPATVDSIVLTTSRIYLGKWNLPGGTDDQCIAGNVTQQ